MAQFSTRSCSPLILQSLEGIALMVMAVFLIAIKNLSANLMDELETDSECIWVRLNCSPKKKVFVGAFYNPNSSHGPDMLSLSLTKLHQMTKGNCDIWLGGDFNLRDINWNDQSVTLGSGFST